MIAWFRSHIRAFGMAGHYLGLSPLSTTLSIIAIGIALALPGAGFWLLNNVEHLVHSLGETHEISLFMTNDAEQADADEIQKRLEANNAVKWRFVSKNEALKNLNKIEGFKDLTAGLPNNPLPDAFVITPHDTSPRAMQDLAQHARTWPKIATVQHDSAWATRYQSILRLGRMGTLILASILAVALIAVTFNTIRLQILSRQLEIEVALLIGATRAWIARPFIWFGLIEGFLGALLAAFILLSIHFLLAPLASDIARSYDSMARLKAPAPLLLAGLLFTGMGLGLIGSWLSTRRSLRNTR